MNIGDSVKLRSSPHEKWWSQIGIVLEIDRAKRKNNDQSVLVHWGATGNCWEYQENLQIFSVAKQE